MVERSTTNHRSLGSNPGHLILELCVMMWHFSFYLWSARGPQFLKNIPRIRASVPHA